MTKETPITANMDTGLRRYDDAGIIQKLPEIHPRNGFTLLEMLLVVFILSAMALTATAFIENEDGQFRFEDTRSRLETLARVMVGQPWRTVNGQPEVSGFVADVGRLPECVEALLVRTADCDGDGNPDANVPAAWALDSTSGLWAGWNGPYLSVLTDSQGNRVFRDGWGNPDTAAPDPNFGWKTFAAVDVDGAPNALTDTLTVQSYGLGGADGGIDYETDYPSGGNLVARADHQLNLQGWQVTVTFVNPPGGGSGSLPVSAETLRLRLFHPQDGTLPASPPATWPATDAERDTAPYLSEDIVLAANAVADGDSHEVTFDFGSTAKYVPWGVRALAVVDDSDGSVYSAAGNTFKKLTLLPRAQLPGVTTTWNLE